jgi:hypothetical protein
MVMAMAAGWDDIESALATIPGAIYETHATTNTPDGQWILVLYRLEDDQRGMVIKGDDVVWREEA